MKKQMDNAALPRVVELLNQVREDLCRITGMGINVRMIGEDMPPTDLGAGSLCYELLFPEIGQGIVDQVETCLTTLEKLATLIEKGAIANQTSEGRR